MIAMIVNFQKYHSRKHFPKASFFSPISESHFIFSLEMIKCFDSFVWLWLLMLNALMKKGSIDDKTAHSAFFLQAFWDPFWIISTFSMEKSNQTILSLINNLFLNFYRRNLYLRFQYPIGWQESEEVGCISLELVGPKKENIDDCKETKLS